MTPNRAPPRAAEEFGENLGMAALALRTALPRVIEYISERSIDEL